MVLPTDINEDQFHGQAFKGFVQFQEPGGTWYRMKERQQMSFNMSYQRSSHYTDDGRKVTDASGSNHTFQMTIKLTSDMFDTTAWTYTNGILNSGIVIDKKTLSYWIYKNELSEPIEIIFVTSFPTLDVGGTPDVNLKFRLDPHTFSTGLSPQGGAPDITVTGIVLSVTSALKSANSEQ
jgi:hypothetical protein